uniref:Mitochondrial import inner membrane translocase subunit TIM50 n=1 Tax=Romanomermis culicivorax TaxID=13658 RepID=A0A915KJJ4_ROMCU
MTLLSKFRPSFSVIRNVYGSQILSSLFNLHRSRCLLPMSPQFSILVDKYSTDNKSDVGGCLSAQTTKIAPTKSPYSDEDRRIEDERAEKHRKSWVRMKKSMLVLGSMIAAGSSFFVYSYGTNRRDDVGNVIVDQFSHLPKYEQIPKRASNELKLFIKSVLEPSREKLLPDPLKEPYYQPKYTVVFEISGVMIHPDWTVRIIDSSSLISRVRDYFIVPSEDEEKAKCNECQYSYTEKAMVLEASKNIWRGNTQQYISSLWLRANGNFLTLARALMTENEKFLKKKFEKKLSTGWRFKKRPALEYFLKALGYPRTELVVYTNEHGITGHPIVENLDTENVIMYKLYRDTTKYQYRDGAYIKDLSKLNRDLSKVIYVDWDNKAFQLNPENALRIPKWSGDDDDTGLVDLANLIRKVPKTLYRKAAQAAKHLRTAMITFY